MRITITFTSKNPLRLPYSYNHILQGFIYKHLNEILGEFLHSKGFSYQKRRFKLFTFSRILGKVKMVDGSFEFLSPLKITISSPSTDILQSLAENLLKRPDATFADKSLLIESITVGYTPEFSDSAEIQMLSPVTTYSTLLRGDGKRKTYYYNPFEEEFSQLLRDNIVKKYKAFYKKDPPSTEFSIEPLRVSKRDEKIITYKNFVIKGWMGRYRVSGNPELLRLAYDAGLGSKNSQGFGCFEVVER